MSRQKHNFSCNTTDPAEVHNNLPIWLPVVRMKKKKKCCRKYEKGKQCKKCPKR